MAETTGERRVVITGLGVVAPNGIGKERFWHATTQGISGIQPIERFATAELPIQVAGEVSDFVAEDFIDRKLVKRSDRMTHFALAAVQEAMRDAGIALARENPHRVGAVIANTFGGVEYVMEQMEALHVRGPRFMSAYTAIAWLQVANVGQVSMRYGIQGYCKTPVNDTVGGLDALGMAYAAIKRGAADVLITGGSEALLHPWVLLVLGHSEHCAMGADTCVYRPFDRRATGLALAEGAGMCILEEYEHARSRDARMYGEIVGYGQSNSACGLAAPVTGGKQYARAMQLALQEAMLDVEDIGYISLDGRAVPAWDQDEADALQQVFGPAMARLPLSVPRTMLGHSYAAAGALDTITALLALQDGIIPPTINCEELDPRYGLANLVRDEARPLSTHARAVLIGGRSLGGANVALAIARPT
ncbi:MAG: beta-ketoacyl-[acyl-carrier-protein] synthase family protein [Chloroflexota bacterium]|nr:beta-ketoacyl-[acyl-carrier-protein] synthase family protein [Chloroflexota bacterium]